jgi:hypothetical protein
MRMRATAGRIISARMSRAMAIFMASLSAWAFEPPAGREVSGKCL